jgi:hypothetical protein
LYADQDGVWKTWDLSSKIALPSFDTPGQFLTLGDKTALFLAVFLKNVRVFDSAFSDCKVGLKSAVEDIECGKTRASRNRSFCRPTDERLRTATPRSRAATSVCFNLSWNVNLTGSLLRHG